MVTRRSPAFYRMIGILGTSRPVRRAHPHLYRLTGGRWLFGRNLGVLNVIVITTGRKTGTRRQTPLFAFEDGRRLVVVGSNAGGDHEPAWVGNLRANPQVQVLVGRQERAVLARETEGSERDRLWALAADGYPGYELYAKRTARHIPVIALEPREA